MTDAPDPQAIPTSEEIRTAMAKLPGVWDRDLATRLGVSEAHLVASKVGEGATRIEAHPDRIIQSVMRLGEVMALTRNDSCVSEKDGVYDNYTPGKHAAMVLTSDIDLRIFPSHWQTAFMVEKETSKGLKRSFQVFDAAGDAVHKIFLRDESRHDLWGELRKDLATEDQSQEQVTGPRQPKEAAKSAPEKADVLRKEWRRLTDTHQFLRLTSKLKMNRLGAYRIAGLPFARRVLPAAVDLALSALAEQCVDVMIFVGNRGCIQIYNGPVKTLKPMGPWQNVLDPGFNLHLRSDDISEVWAVEKPTQRGPAVSLEAFDAEGGLIFQIFGTGSGGKDGKDTRPAWRVIVDTLPGVEEEAIVQ